MSISYSGGHVAHHDFAIVSKFKNGEEGLLVGYGSDGHLRKAGDCYRFAGLFLGSGATFGQGFDAAVLGVTWFRSRFFERCGLVIGGDVYARDGLVVSAGVHRIGTLVYLDEKYVEVVVCCA